MNPTQLVEAFVAAWNRMDFDTVLAMLDEQVVYHNIPMPVLNGRDAVKGFLEAGPRFERIEWRMLSIAGSGNKVLTERVDDFWVSGRKISIPVMGTFEVRDGRITAWRDYFDLPTFQNQLMAALAPPATG